MAKSKYLFGMVCTVLILIIFTIGCFENNEKINDQEEKTSIILTITCNGYQTNYTLDELEYIESYSDTGRFIKTKLLPDSVEISDYHEYTGIRIITLLEQVANLPDNYTVNIVSNDDWVVDFTKDEILGNVDTYNENGEIISSDVAVMLIAYKEDGQDYFEIDAENDIGPFRIAFVGDDVITSSALWSKMVITIEIIAI